jgi:hypothetical protein
LHHSAIRRWARLPRSPSSTRPERSKTASAP